MSISVCWRLDIALVARSLNGALQVNVQKDILVNSSEDSPQWAVQSQQLVGTLLQQP